MPANSHNRVAELHNQAEHEHDTASKAHEKKDHLAIHKLSKKALKHSMNAYWQSEGLIKEGAVSKNQ